MGDIVDKSKRETFVTMYILVVLLSISASLQLMYTIQGRGLYHAAMFVLCVVAILLSIIRAERARL